MLPVRLQLKNTRNLNWTFSAVSVYQPDPDLHPVLSPPNETSTFRYISLWLLGCCVRLPVMRGTEEDVVHRLPSWEGVPMADANGCYTTTMPKEATKPFPLASLLPYMSDKSQAPYWLLLFDHQSLDGVMVWARHMQVHFVQCKELCPKEAYENLIPITDYCSWESMQFVNLFKICLCFYNYLYLFPLTHEDPQ